MLLDEFIHRLVTRPNEAFIHINGREAFVYDTERDTILHLQGNFQGLREKVSWEVRHAIAEQHPISL